MKSPLHILHRENDSNDAALLQYTLTAAALEDGDMTHIGTVAKTSCAFCDDAHGTHRNLQTWREPGTIILNSGLQKSDNCFLIRDTIEDSGSSKPINASCNSSKNEQEGLNI
jgi:hypothetical protein